MFAQLTTGLAASACLAVATLAAPLSDVDFSKLPPDIGTVQVRLQDSKTSLAQAIELALKEVKGVVRSATFDLNGETPMIEVLIYGDGKATNVMIDPATGTVKSTADVPRLPGLPVQGVPSVSDTGLLYYDITEGDGAQPQSNSVLQAHYTGWLVDGTMFDTSHKGTGVPATFMLNQQIKGWTEGFGSMKVGGKRKLMVPPPLAYGERAGGIIPANAMLIFDVELLAVDPYTNAPPTDKLPGDTVSGNAVTTPSGLQYYDLKVGEGEQPPGSTAKVKVHFTGWLNDGTKFYSSFDQSGGEPYVTSLLEVIPGWTEGIQSMKVGGKRKLVVPYNLAYGEPGKRDPQTRAIVIPPKAVLIFDIELLEVVK